MGVRIYKPTSPGRRAGSVSDFKDITKKTPEKSLLVKLKKRSGRNNHGRVTMRHHGGGHKPIYRIVDFRRDKAGVPARVAAVEYDPNRSARIALLHYHDGEKRYIICPNDLTVGQTVVSGEAADPAVGNTMTLRRVPPGMAIHNIELRPGQGGKLVRSAGVSATLQAKEGDYALVQLPSKEVRRIHLDCKATIGQVGNPEHQAIKIGKAGRNRWRGIRPTVRGSAMNPVAHPMGGGEGRRSGGRHPKSKWGVPAKGGKTRNRKKASTKHIIRRRKQK